MLGSDLTIILNRARYVVSELSREIYHTFDKDTGGLENEQLQVSHLISCIDFSFTTENANDTLDANGNILNADIVFLGLTLKSLIGKYTTVNLVANPYYVAPLGNFFQISIDPKFLQVSNLLSAPSTIGLPIFGNFVYSFNNRIGPVIAQYADYSFGHIAGTLTLLQDYATGVTAGTYNTVTVNAQGRVTAATVVPYASTNGPIVLTGPVLGTAVNNLGTSYIATSLALQSVTYASIQNVGNGALLGRWASTPGSVQEILLGTGLSLVNGTLSAVLPGYSASNGVLLSGSSFSLGGILLQATTILGNSVSLSLGTVSSKLSIFSAIAGSIILGSTTTGSTLQVVSPTISLSGYLGSRNDTATVAPANFLYTDGSGNLLSSPLSSILTITPSLLRATNTGTSGYLPSYSNSGQFTWVAPQIAYSFGNGLSTNGTTISIGGMLSQDAILDGSTGTFNVAFNNLLGATIGASTINLAASTALLLSGRIGLVTPNSAQSYKPAVGSLLAISSYDTTNGSIAYVDFISSVPSPSIDQVLATGATTSRSVTLGAIVTTTAALNTNTTQAATCQYVMSAISTFRPFVYKQTTPSNSTLVTHGLNRYPIVQVINTATGEVVGVDITHKDLNNVLISYAATAITWIATFN